MNHPQLIELMHAVLDGEATSDERRALETALGRDPSARSEFEELRKLFEGLRAVPQPFPPEGLVASVIANAPRPGSDGDAHQLFGATSVFEQNSKKTRG